MAKHIADDSEMPVRPTPYPRKNAKHKHKWGPWAISILGTPYRLCRCGEVETLNESQATRILNAHSKWRYVCQGRAEDIATTWGVGDKDPRWKQKLYIRERRP